MDALMLAQTSRAADAYAGARKSRSADMLARAAGQDADRVRAAAQEFEAFFVGQMMEYMSAGLSADENFGGGHAEDTWRSMLNQEYGKQIAKSGRLGVADHVMTAMLRAQEERTKAAEQLTATTAPQQVTP
jgi:Rod binding domain-containing protein